MGIGTRLTPSLIDFIQRQKLFFVATAATTGRVNLSPKGADALRVKGPNLIRWLNLSGTVSHAEDHEGAPAATSCTTPPPALAWWSTGAAVWPLVNQMNPSADVQAAQPDPRRCGRCRRGHAADRASGSASRCSSATAPKEEIAAAREVTLEDLVDQDARNDNIGRADASDENRSLRRGREHRRMAGADGRLHAPGLCAASATMWATSAAGSAPATARTTTRQAASAAAPRPRTFRSRLRNSSTKPTILLG
jgi:hypothetical protein